MANRYSADDGGELQHRIAQHIRRQRPAASSYSRPQAATTNTLASRAMSMGRGAAVNRRSGCVMPGVQLLPGFAPGLLGQPAKHRTPTAGLRAHSAPTWLFSISYGSFSKCAPLNSSKRHAAIHQLGHKVGVKPPARCGQANPRGPVSRLRTQCLTCGCGRSAARTNSSHRPSGRPAPESSVC